MEPMQSIRIEVPGTPVGKARPRVTFQGGRARAYTTDRTREYENRVKTSYLKKYGRKQLDGALQVDVIAYFEPPRSTSKRMRASMLDGDVPYTKKPDIDNIIKSVTDALNEVAYADDSEIIAVYGFKCYGEYAHTDVVITKIGGRYVYEQ